MAQSNRCSGLETTRDDTTSPTVSGPRLPITEAGLRVAWYRCRTATSASSSLVTPELMHVPLRPHRVPRRHVGAVHVAAPVIDPRRRARGLPPARPDLPAGLAPEHHDHAGQPRADGQGRLDDAVRGAELAVGHRVAAELSRPEHL